MQENNSISGDSFVLPPFFTRSNTDIYTNREHVHNSSHLIGSWVNPREAVKGSDLHRALKYLSPVKDKLQAKKKTVVCCCSLLQEFFPVSAFLELPVFFQGRAFPGDRQQALVTVLAFLDLKLRFFKHDCIDPSIVHKVSAKYGFPGVTRQALVRERKRLFPLVLQSFPPAKRAVYRKNYSLSRDVETRKLEQAAIQKLVSISRSADKSHVTTIAEKLFAMMKRACYQINDPDSFLHYFPFAVYRVAGYEWHQLTELLGILSDKVKKAVKNFLFRIGIRLSALENHLEAVSETGLLHHFSEINSFESTYLSRELVALDIHGGGYS